MKSPLDKHINRKELQYPPFPISAIVYALIVLVIWIFIGSIILGVFSKI